MYKVSRSQKSLSGMVGRGHVGGLAALLVELYKDIGAVYTPKDIADYLKVATTGIKSGISYPNDNWGHGFSELPCRSEAITFPRASITTDSWSIDDCASSRRGATYADYYSFYVSEETDLEITLSSVTDTILYLVEGAYTGGSNFTAYNDDYPGLINVYDSRTLRGADCPDRQGTSGHRRTRKLTVNRR